MSKNLKLSIFFLLIFSSNIFGQDNKIITLVADEWGPYNCRPTDINKGYLVEIAEKIFEPKGYQIKYIRTSWNRAIFGTRNGQFDGIIGTGKLETPDFIFPDNEQGIAKHCLFVLSNSKWVYSGITSLHSIILGVIENYSYGNLFEEYIEPNKDNKSKVQIITGDNPLIRNLKKLELGRITATIEDEKVMNFCLKQNKLSFAIKNVGVLSEEKIYIAFSPKNKNANVYADILDKGIVELRKNGELKQILQKYELTD